MPERDWDADEETVARQLEFYDLHPDRAMSAELDGWDRALKDRRRLSGLLAWQPGPPKEPGRYDLLIRNNRTRGKGQLYRSAGETLTEYKGGDDGDTHPRTYMALDDMAEVAFDDDQEVIAHFRIPSPPKAEAVK